MCVLFCFFLESQKPASVMFSLRYKYAFRLTSRNYFPKGSADWNDCNHDFTVIIYRIEMCRKCDGFHIHCSCLLKWFLWLYRKTNLLYLPYVYLYLAIHSDYIILVLSGKWMVSPASIAHIGCATPSQSNWCYLLPMLALSFLEI